MLDAAFATCCLHVESRIASRLKVGFYTIGPCGEEALAPIGLILEPTDPTALHYRHLSPFLARHLRCGRSMADLLVDRARGYTGSAADPAAGGVHCSIGGGFADFLVTSTLASQTPPAVGRALGIALASKLLRNDAPFPASSVSFVSLGDGSVANAHFLAGLHLAQRAAGQQLKCPLVVCITDNDLCISLRGKGDLTRWLKDSSNIPQFFAAGSNPLDVAAAATSAIGRSRRQQRPVLLVLRGIIRRFGHAATDRQFAYMSPDEITRRAETSTIAPMIRQAVEHGVGSVNEHLTRFEEIARMTTRAFATAVAEAGVTRADVLERLAAPLAPVLPGGHERWSRKSIALDALPLSDLGAINGAPFASEAPLTASEMCGKEPRQGQPRYC